MITDKPLYELGGKGLFTKELEQALLSGSIDFAVHSLKDVPVTMPLVDQGNLVIAAIPQREDPRDVLVCQTGSSLGELPRGAKVGTGSLRRRCQILARRPDVIVEGIRGNIDTRVKKLQSNAFDAVVLALAGTRRAGIFDSKFMHPIEPAELLPAPGQGALALQCRRNDQSTIQTLASIDDHITRACVSAERELVRLLQCDCHSPVAALAETSDETAMILNAVVGGRDGRPPIVTASAAGSLADPTHLAQIVFAKLEAQNVRSFLHG
jgi:hydroxymethylbilane synthase